MSISVGVYACMYVCICVCVHVCIREIEKEYTSKLIYINIRDYIYI